jgi:hypothetical protein
MTRLSHFQYWTRFALLASVFLVGWFVFWEVKNQGWLRLADFSSVLPVRNADRILKHCLLSRTNCITQMEKYNFLDTLSNISN